MKRIVKDIEPQLPIFGNDTAEVEALRTLAKTVGFYLAETVDVAELDAAFHHYQKVKRSKRVN